LNSSYYYVLQGSSNKTYGSVSSLLFKDCETSVGAGGDCGAVKSWYIVFGNGATGGSGTRIETVAPYSGQLLATSTHTTVGSTGFISSSDFNSYSELDINLQNSANSFQNCADVICAGLSSSSINLDFVYPLTTEGYYFYSSSTQTLPIGKYYVKTKIKTGSFCLLGLCALTRDVVATSTSFTISTTTKLDKLKDAVDLGVADFASTTIQSFQNCGIADFDLFMCGKDMITYAFVPTSDALSSNMQLLHDNVLTHFPLGYLTDFYSIISTSTAGTLSVLSMTVPNGVIGTGASLSLNLTGVLDPLLNATTSTFNNVSASSTQTFYQVTSYYWNLVLYIMALFYIISRVIGSHLIPKLI